MIASLRGVVQEKSPHRVVVEVQGVGYDVKVPLSTYGVLPESGSEVSLLIYTLVRDEGISLYGFATPRERLLFERMLSVSGVGPRIAVALLSGLPPEELVGAVRSGAAEILCRVPGVGRRTAERIVVDLRDKLERGVEGSPRPGVGVGWVAGSERAVVADVISALTNLGYPGRDAERAVSEARQRSTPGKGEQPADVPRFQELLREALRRVTVTR